MRGNQCGFLYRSKASFFQSTAETTNKTNVKCVIVNHEFESEKYKVRVPSIQGMVKILKAPETEFKPGCMLCEMLNCAIPIEAPFFAINCSAIQIILNEELNNFVRIPWKALNPCEIKLNRAPKESNKISRLHNFLFWQ